MSDCPHVQRVWMHPPLFPDVSDVPEVCCGLVVVEQINMMCLCSEPFCLMCSVLLIVLAIHCMILAELMF